MGDRSRPTPDDIPRSPSGRVPKWVMDEAAGRAPTEAVPFRAPPSTSRSLVETPRGSRSRWGRTVLSLTLLAAVIVALALVGRMLPGFTPTAPAAATGGPPAGQGEAPAPLGSPPPGTPDPAHRFLAFQRDGTTPVTWSPCRPIKYVVRAANTPPSGARMINESVAIIARASGLSILADGPTAEAPSSRRDLYQPERYGDRWAPVLVAWATRAEVPDFGVDIAGEAGPASITTPSGDDTFVSGTVFLDPTKVGTAAGGKAYLAQRAVVLHELGHLLGLAHVDDRRQVMWPRSERTSPVDFQAGDRAGLARLGTGPCQPDA